jgi:hypothetical protein
MAKRNGVVALEASDVSISTASVTIKALQVSNRQMTQSVFRQLPERALIDEEKVELLGLPWGWVNHSISGQEGNRQFVAQFGTTLCRCPVPNLLRSSEGFGAQMLRPDCLPKPFARIAAGYVRDAVCMLCADIIEGRSLQYDNFPILMEGESPFVPIYIGEKLTVEDVCRYRFGGGPSGQLGAVSKFAAQQGIRRIDKALLDCDKGTFEGRLWGHLEAGRAFCSRWDVLMARLWSVEQLFIAA